MQVEDDDANEASAMMGPDEAFQLFDDLVADWKAQLEAVIGEGLKKMRKNGKEKKLMMQYLPGSEDKSSKMTEAAKTAIVKVRRLGFPIVLGTHQNILSIFRSGCPSSTRLLTRPARNWKSSRRQSCLRPRPRRTERCCRQSS
jgi:hypothetical protein